MGGGKEGSDEQVAAMREAFLLFDTDGDGRIAVSELGILMRSLGGNPTQAQLKEIVAQEHLTGPFDFPRFLELTLKHLKPEPFDRQLRDAFRVLDKEGSGLVAVSDLRHILTSIGEKLEPAEFDEWIREVDVGADGNIHYEDFILRMVAKGNFPVRWLGMCNQNAEKRQAETNSSNLVESQICVSQAV
ncbi:hypothetical protein Taro_034428 [Colocasia esculenta]|uniref:EF-hand domain-containing protein n=1 Tax=Colocasia esculenta TaxID=4460 RepID=A0A843VXT0_COLES|nr:hypothetical protein [Colocasia esculenta]